MTLINNDSRFDALLTFWCKKSLKWHRLTETNMRGKLLKNKM